MSESDGQLLDELGKSLRRAVRESWTRAIARHADENFYAYILYTEPSLGYAGPSFNTEEALARIGHNDAEREELRWSPPDWKYHMQDAKLFGNVQAVLRSLGTETGYRDKEQWQRRWRVFMESLAALDREGLFGTGEGRNSLTVNIMWGDQDAVAHVQSARELNPKESYLRFARSQLSWLHDWRKEIERSQSAHKVDAIGRIDETIAMIQDDLESE